MNLVNIYKNVYVCNSNDLNLRMRRDYFQFKI